MDHKILLKILDVYEIAATDEEYLRLYADYAPAQKKCKDCWSNYHKTNEKASRIICMLQWGFIIGS